MAHSPSGNTTPRDGQAPGRPHAPPWPHDAMPTHGTAGHDGSAMTDGAMPPRPSTDAATPTDAAGPVEALPFTDLDRQTLREVARQAVWYAAHHRRAMTVDPRQFPPALRQRRAVFVTLTLNDQLRGCIGTLEPVRTLIEDTARNAHAAATQDPRFPPLLPAEAGLVSVHLSILSPPEPVDFTDEADLLARLRPGTDGLILEHAGRRGTFLPAVWEQLPDPARFLEHLKRKAGLPTVPLTADARVWRYTCESIA